MRLAPYLACALFAGLGLLLLPYPGAQYDEVFFFNALHGRGVVEYAMKFSFGAVPIMMVSYAGTLKAALYAPLLHWFDTGDLTLRLPVLVFGAISIGLFFLTARRLAGPRAAGLVTLLLATDAVYLLTCIFDWGPVALQHLLAAGAVYSLVRYSRDRAARWLVAGALLSGLALWNKALFAWQLVGYGLAWLIIYRAEIRRVTRRHRAAALLGFLLGAAPLLYYNKIHRLRTFTANASAGVSGGGAKIASLARTLDGSALFGYLVREAPVGAVREPRKWESLAVQLDGALGGPRRSFQQFLLWGALLLGAIVCWFGPYRRLALFVSLGCGLTFAQMLLISGAGTAAHHSILLWPAPQILLAMLLAQITELGRPRVWRTAAALVLAATVSNLTVVSSYLAHLIAYGPGPVWSDAIRPLVREISGKPGRMVFAVDWGITQQLEWYGRGRLGLHKNSDGVVNNLPQPESTVSLERNLADSANLFVMHAEGYETFAGVRRKLIDFAAGRGYQDVIVQTIQDRHGDTVFEIHEFRK